MIFGNFDAVKPYTWNRTVNGTENDTANYSVGQTIPRCILLFLIAYFFNLFIAVVNSAYQKVENNKKYYIRKSRLRATMDGLPLLLLCKCCKCCKKKEKGKRNGKITPEKDTRVNVESPEAETLNNGIALE